MKDWLYWTIFFLGCFWGIYTIKVNEVDLVSMADLVFSIFGLGLCLGLMLQEIQEENKVKTEDDEWSKLLVKPE